MKINNLTNQTNFKGYSNILADDYVTPKGRLTFIAMELNNEGKKDLSEFNQLKAMYGMPKYCNIITMRCTNVNNNEVFCINDNVLHSGNDLFRLRSAFGDSNEYKRIEDKKLKANTLMASLTKRIKENPRADENLGFNAVFWHLYKEFCGNRTQNMESVYTALRNSALGGVPRDKVAEVINNIIVKNMNQFFRF